MKLFFLIGFFSLIFVSCQKEGKPTEQNPKNVEKLSEKNQQGAVEVFTITHQASNDEDVLISYENPNNGKKASRFKMEPSQCLKFTSEHFQFIKNIKLGIGLGRTPKHGTGEFKVMCGSLLPEDRALGHIDYLVFVDTTLTPDENLGIIQNNSHLCLPGESEKEECSKNEILPCSNLGNSSYEVKDVGALMTDRYFLKKSDKNTSTDCQLFEEIL